MNMGRTILETANPKTQSLDAIKSLLAYVGRSADPLPSDVSLEDGRLVLVLSKKRDVYYTTTSRACSCPAHNFGHGQRCKHQRRYFPVEATNSIRPKVGAFRPVSLLPSEEKAQAAPIYVDTLEDPTPREIAYWSIKADREMWPAEA